MRRILFILTVITFALAVPVLVQEKRQAPGDVTTVLGKRTLAEDLAALWEGRWHFKNVIGGAAPPPQLPRPPDIGEVQLSEAYVPPQSLADPSRESMAALSDDTSPVTPHSSPGPPTETSVPSAESQSEKPKAADPESKDKKGGLMSYFPYRWY